MRKYEEHHAILTVQRFQRLQIVNHRWKPKYAEASIILFYPRIRVSQGRVPRRKSAYPAKPRAHFIFLPFFRLADDLLRCDLQHTKSEALRNMKWVTPSSLVLAKAK
jgi:hypothetical protein